MNAERKQREQRELNKRMVMDTLVREDIQSIFERKEKDRARELTEKHKEIMKKIEERERNHSIRQARYFASLESVSSKQTPLYKVMEQIEENAKVQELERRKQFLAERRQLYQSINNNKGFEADIRRAQELGHMESEYGENGTDNYRARTLNQRKYKSKILQKIQSDGRLQLSPKLVDEFRLPKIKRQQPEEIQVTKSSTEKIDTPSESYGKYPETATNHSQVIKSHMSSPQPDFNYEQSRNVGGRDKDVISGEMDQGDRRPVVNKANVLKNVFTVVNSTKALKNHNLVFSKKNTGLSKMP